MARHRKTSAQLRSESNEKKEAAHKLMDSLDDLVPLKGSPQRREEYLRRTKQIEKLFAESRILQEKAEQRRLEERL